MPRPTATQRRRIESDQLELYKNDIRHISDAGAPTDGTTGDGAGKCGPGSLYFDTNTGFIWVNEGTKASPDWEFAGTQVST